MSENRRETAIIAGIAAMLIFQVHTISKIGDVDRRLSRIETVMVMQKLIPGELIAEANDQPTRL